MNFEKSQFLSSNIISEDGTSEKSEENLFPPSGLPALSAPTADVSDKGSPAFGSQSNGAIITPTLCQFSLRRDRAPRPLLYSPFSRPCLGQKLHSAPPNCRTTDFSPEKREQFLHADYAGRQVQAHGRAHATSRRLDANCPIRGGMIDAGVPEGACQRSNDGISLYSIVFLRL